MRDFQHIVVGGGISGMSTALLLAKQGRKTALVESFPVLAPTIRGFKRKGVHFETGVHLLGGLGHNHPLDIYFRHLGVAQHLKKFSFNRDGFDCFRYEKQHREIRLPVGYENLRSTLCKEFPNEQDAIGQYLEKIRSTFNSSPYLNFNQDFSFEDAVHAGTTTLSDYLDSLTENRDLKDLLSYQSMLYGTPPTDAMLSTHALVAGSYAISCHTVEGGGLSIVRAYEKELKKQGVEIFCSSTVTRIGSTDKREFSGVTLDDRIELNAESCVWTAHPATMVKCTGQGGFRPAFRKRILALEETPSALILFAVSEQKLPELVGKNIYLWPEGNYSRILKGQEKIADNAIFISAAQSNSGEGPQAVTAITPFSAESFNSWQNSSLNDRPRGYLEFKAQLRHEFEQALQKRCPELYAGLNVVDFATPLTLRDYCASPSGSMYGAAHTASQYNPLPATRIKGLFMAGQSIIAPGLLGAVVSAYLAGGIICGHEIIHEELRCIYKG